MKPTADELARAVRKLGVLRFFPVDADSRETIMELLERMVNTREELGWLIRIMVDRVCEWQGPAELRGVYCAYGALTGAALRGWTPADGVWFASSISGFTQEDRNSAFLAASDERDYPRRRLTSAIGAPRLLSAAEKQEPVTGDDELNAVVFGAVKRMALPAPTAADREYSRRLLHSVMAEIEESHR